MCVRVCTRGCHIPVHMCTGTHDRPTDLHTSYICVQCTMYTYVLCLVLVHSTSTYLVCTIMERHGTMYICTMYICTFAYLSIYILHRGSILCTSYTRTYIYYGQVHSTCVHSTYVRVVVEERVEEYREDAKILLYHFDSHILFDIILPFGFHHNQKIRTRRERYHRQNVR